MFKQFAPTEPTKIAPKIAPKYVDSSSEEEGEEEPRPEPILQARDSLFVVVGTQFDVDIRESSKIRDIIGTCAFVRDNGQVRYAFLWKSGMNAKYFDLFGWDYPTDDTILKIGKGVALQNGFTRSEVDTLK